MVTKAQKLQARKDLVNYWRDVAERGVRVFVYSYLATWVGAGTKFDVLFTRNNVEAGVIGLALSVAVSVGVKNIGDKDSASIFPEK